ncbi:hypothetical protein GA0111570_109119 [Raineyella antarctica]|uniref:Uncharacterized protein n=1 Tax=Raineyella antarctica TaxID=1577474 RepID=A0A1G6HFT8_9ACTN|nr:hypothetical protein [Raineyella antarctica]SDB93197.1 hypothetical protein GA0111570_109119 [Raineyella antarctica]
MKQDNPLARSVESARLLLDRIDTDQPTLDDVTRLTEAGEHLTSALNEAMAAVALSGASIRQVAAAARIAPNSVGPRLAASAPLEGYVEEGRVSGESLSRARYDASRSNNSKSRPLRFSTRKPDDLS